MRKLIWSLTALSLSAVLLVGQEPQPDAPTAPLGQVQPMGAPAAPPVVSPYRVKKDNGHFFICAACYTGEHAPYLADQVVRQLRAKNINSFVYNYADKERFKREQEYHEWKKTHPDGGVYRARFTKIELQVAVLIGGFKTMDDARNAVPTVRQLPPPKVTFPSGEDAAAKLMIYGEGLRTGSPEERMGSRGGFVSDFSPSRFEAGVVHRDGEEEETHPLKEAHVNPFESCFVVRNPVAEKKQDDDNYVDPRWKQMNATESYSLLRCKKKFTLVVKVYRGPKSYQSAMNAQKKEGGFLSKVGRADPGDVLEATAMQAHELARFLRTYKYEAYVLHTQFCSVVTVGGFAEQGGQEMIEMAQRLGKLRLKGTQTVSGAQSIDPAEDPFSLLPDPMPMRVPKL